MRAKLWLTLGGSLAIALGLTVGTLALFTAETPVDSVQFEAGTVRLNSYRDMGDTIPGPMFYTTPTEGQTPGGVPGRRPTGYWAPGDNNVRALFVENSGNLDAWLVGIGAEAQAGSSRHLAEKLQAKVTTDLAGTNVLASGTLASLIDTDQAFATRLALNVGPAPRALYFHVTLPLDADNSYQNEVLRVDFHVMAEQKANNP